MTSFSLTFATWVIVYDQLMVQVQLSDGLQGPCCVYRIGRSAIVRDCAYQAQPLLQTADYTCKD